MWDPHRLPQIFRERCQEKSGLGSHPGGGRRQKTRRNTVDDRGIKRFTERN